MKEGLDDEAIEVHGRADYCGSARAGGGAFDRRGLPQAWDQHWRTFYAWKAKFGGMEVSEAKQSSSLRTNAKLKRLLADAMLDNAALKDLVTKKF